MVPGWLAIAAWLVAWTLLARVSLGLLEKVRPGETVPLRWTGKDEPRWRVSPVLAAALMPLLAFILGVVTIVASFFTGGGRAPAANLLIAGLLVFVHFIHVRRSVQTLERERGG